jgi:hypothetical protein
MGRHSARTHGFWVAISYSKDPSYNEFEMSGGDVGTASLRLAVHEWLWRARNSTPADGRHSHNP